MYYKGGMMELPPVSAKIWRYMDLTKLLSVLECRSLFFANLTALGDAYEGYLPLPTFEEYRGMSLPSKNKK